ncbi:hypothetical protein [Amycolatopsis dongchuanensis]|uniref:Uncharacterized protein n=1 Tax=Amycolatopsis dongchuanensis TaxID=1070866 RepID=A0ABP8VF11_9PSEU
MDNSHTEQLTAHDQAMSIRLEEPARPEPPEVGRLDGPEELPRLHRRLMDQATVLDGEVMEDWTRAASQVGTLWHEWSGRMHAVAAHEAMREAANHVVTALCEALRHAGDWRETNRWFRLSNGWIKDLTMQADRQFGPITRAQQQP